MQNHLELINMQDIEVEEVSWLWYPYIPFGKITLLHGDGGDGKTTMTLAIAAAVTRGLALPETDAVTGPVNIIYQNAEDGLGDTIKPRLLAAGADCTRVFVIDDSKQGLSLSDTRIEQAIVRQGAKLFILDPLQAYLGDGVDMHRANEVRPILSRLGDVAARTGCAVVIVGHLNKGSGAKSQYRGLGSVDIYAAARSVLTLGRVKEHANLRAFAQGKNNLAPEGASIAFELNPETGFQWVGEYPITIDELLQGAFVIRESAFNRAENLLNAELAGKTLPSTVVLQLASDQGISERTLKRAKAKLGVHSFKREGQWFCSLTEGGE